MESPNPTPLEQLHERLLPVMREHLDGYVIVGYAPNAEGKRERICIVNGGNDAAIADGLASFASFGMAWANRARPTPEAATPEASPS